MAFFSKFFASTDSNTLTGDDFFGPDRPQRSFTGIRVTPDSSLKCAAVFRAVTILADILATLPLAMYKLKVPGLVDGGMDPMPDHPLHDVLCISPNSYQTPAEFWGFMGFHAALRGNAYAEIIPGPRGAVQELLPIHPDRISDPELLMDGTYRYRVTDPRTNQTRILLQSELLRIPGLSSDGVTGLKTVDLAADAISLLMAADQSAARMFSNRLNMGGFFKHPGRPSESAIKRLQQMMMDRFAGVFNAHRPMVLGEGMDYVQASYNAKDSQLLEARKWQISEIGRFFGIPAHMLNVDDQTNRSTVEEQSLNFVRYRIRPWVDRCAQAIRRDLIIAPRLYIAVFNLDELESGNMEARANYISKALGSGGSPPWLTQDEARSMEGWNKIGSKESTTLAIGTNPGQPAPNESISITAQSTAPPAPASETEKITVPGQLIAQGAVSFPAIIETVPVAIVDPKKTNGHVESVSDSEKQVISNGEALVRKEITAIRKYKIRFADNDAAFKDSVRAFYGGFISQVVTKLDVTKDQAKAWCFRRAERICDAVNCNDELDLMEAELDSLNGAENGKNAAVS